MTQPKTDEWDWRTDKSGARANRWKGNDASVTAFHKWLNKHHGKPSFCSNVGCKGKSRIFEWCLRVGHKYTHNPKDFLWLCRSCHRRYDLTPQKLEQATKNLWWVRGIPHPNPTGKNRYSYGK